jgi:8-oxo-dGTP diphosphatase
MNKQNKKYKFAVIATDIVVFKVESGQLKVLLIEMKKSPFQGFWAVPGGLVRPHESVDHAADRVLREKGGITDRYIEQLYTFGRIDRDPFGRVVSVAYLALVSNPRIKIQTTDEYSNISWVNIKHLPKLAYDHKEIIETAVHRLKAKLGYTNVAYSLLPKEFTFSELQGLYETVLNRKLDKRNFRKKLRALKLVKKLDKKKRTGPNRPAALYTFSQTKPQHVDIL